MDYKSRLKLFIVMILASNMILPSYSQQIEKAPFDTNGDDKAVAFRQTPEGNELWLTQNAGNTRSKQLVSMKCLRDGFGPAEPVKGPGFDRIMESQPLILDGSPAFAECNGNYGVFASNRYYNKKDYKIDLYEMKYDDSKGWSVDRLDAVNSEYWDDTPAFSHDGNILYFSSDRLSPNIRRAAIFYSLRTPEGWSAPELLPVINSLNYSQEAPFVGPDDYLYYSTNRNGNYDIWRVKLSPDGIPDGKPEPLDEQMFPGVNSPTSDETHPSFSPGSNWFIFSSNRGGRDLDVYWLKVNRIQPEIEFNVILRTKEKYFGADSIAPVNRPIIIYDLVNNNRREKITPKNGKAIYTLDQVEGNYPGEDLRLRELMVYAVSNDPKYVSSIDTLLLDVNCSDRLIHDVILWDTATYRTPSCEQDFPVYKVRFFITGYWCPTTKQYQNYSPCSSLFVDETCLQEPCKSNEVYTFEVVKRQVADNCVSYGEFNSKGGEFAAEVDSAINQLRQSMASAFHIPCVKRAIEMGEIVQVEIIGYTDARELHYNCTYTGPDYDEIKGFPEPDEKIIPFIKNGIKFRSEGYGGEAGGNQLLSDLRAYYTALLLDSLWTETNPTYRRLKYDGQLNVKAYGKAISMEKTSMERQRSIRVKITVPNADEIIVEGYVPEPSQLRVLCDNCFDYKVRPVLARQFKMPKVEIDYSAAEAPEPMKPVTVQPSTREMIITTDKEKTTETEQPKVIGTDEDKYITSTEEYKDCNWAVKFAEFEDIDAARDARDKLMKEKFDLIRIERSSYYGVTSYRVLLGCYKTKEDAMPVLFKVKSMSSKLGEGNKASIVRLNR